MIFDKKSKMKKIINDLMEKIKKEKDYEKEKEKILNLATDSEKEEVINNLIERIKTFIDYDDFENFPINNWIDVFFLNEDEK